MSFLLIGSSNDRPISRLMAKMVRSGLVTACRLAGWPTRRSPSSVNATMDGVVRAPSEFSITLGVEPSMTATHELVVPRSMPITFAISYTPSSSARPPSPKAARPERRIPPITSQPSADVFRSPSFNAKFGQFGAFFEPEPTSPGVYRWGVLSAQGAEAADSASFELLIPIGAKPPAPSPFSPAPLHFANDSRLPLPDLRALRRLPRGKRDPRAIDAPGRRSRRAPGGESRPRKAQELGRCGAASGGRR